MKRLICVLLVFFVAVVLLSSCLGSSPVTEVQKALDPTTATDKPITVNVNIEGEGVEVDGLYTGDLKNGLPNGTGAFVVDTDEGKLSYKGIFTDGQITGDGVLKIIVDGNDLTYEGSFVNGALSGYGTTIAIDESQTIRRKGNYTNGVYTPTVGQKYDYLGQMDLYGVFGLEDNVISYIDSHPEYFPKADKPDAEAAVLRDFEYRQFSKYRKQDTIGLIKLNLSVIQIREDEFEETGDTVTYLLAMDENENLYTLYYLGSVELYDGDRFIAYGIPVALTSYSNVSGGTSIAIAVIASYFDVLK